MAYVFTPEDGTGLPTANSFVSVEEANDILYTNIHVTSWDLLQYYDKERLLSWATRILDTKVTWYGKKTYPTSALRWPRSGIIDRDKIALADDEIPQRLKEATAEFARLLVDTDRTTEQSRDGLTRLKVDVIELEFDKDYRLTVIPKTVWETIADLGYIGSASGAARIIKV